MADIFISYSREDRPRVEPLTAALVSAGYSVWWDKDLAGGSRYLDKTEAELNAAKAVLVVWTKTSIASHWVADEAGAGRDSGRLVPISIEGTMPPLGFRQFQVIDFSRWKPGDEAKLGELRTALANVIGSSAAPAVAAASEPRKAISKRVLMLGGLAAAGIAAVAAVAVLASGLLGGAERIEVGTQLFAFYGFTAPEGDAVATEIAERATDQTFQGLGAMHVETAARTETVGKSADQYLDQAEKLGARFALSGSVRSEAGSQRVNVSMRLQDVPSRKMLWEQTLSADASAPAAVADRIAAHTADDAGCMGRGYFRLAKQSSDPDVVRYSAVFCSNWRGGSPESVRALRKLIQVVPNDGEFQALLVLYLGLQIGAHTPAELPALLAETDRTATRAVALEPNGNLVAWARYSLAFIHNASLVEAEGILADRLQHTSEGPWDVVTEANLNVAYGRFLGSVGRTRAALPYLTVATEEQPLVGYTTYALGQALAATGQGEKAGRVFDQTFVRPPAPAEEGTRMGSAVMLGGGDAERLLAAPPPDLPAPELVCWRDMQAALKSRDGKPPSGAIARIKTCMADGNMRPGWTLAFLAEMGDLDGAFAVAPNQPVQLELGQIGAQPLFWPMTHAMRADPRFPPLVEKLGLMDYWRTTGTLPDVCESEAAPFCLQLKAQSQR